MATAMTDMGVVVRAAGGPEALEWTTLDTAVPKSDEVLIEQRAIGVKHHSRVVIKTGGAALEDRRDDDNFQLARELAERFGGGTGNRFGQVEIVGIFFAAEILRTEKLFEADDLRSTLGRLADGLHRARKICGRIFRTLPLQQADGEFLAHEGILPDQRRGVFVFRGVDDAADAAQDGIEHRRCEPARLRVLLAGMVACEKMRQIAGQLVFGAVRKLVTDGRGEPPLLHQQAQVGVKRDGTERQHSARPQNRELILEIARAVA